MNNIQKLQGLFSPRTTLLQLKFVVPAEPNIENDRSSLEVIFSNVQGVEFCVLFVGVRNLIIHSGPYSPVQVIGLQIEDMAAAQWPGVGARVFSEEEETEFSFLCGEIVFLD